MQADFEGGKYRVEASNGHTTAFRHGKVWRDLTGDKLVLCMLTEVVDLRHLNDCQSILLDEARAEIAELRQWAKERATHKQSCQCNYGAGKACDCGLAEIVATPDAIEPQAGGQL